MSDGKHWGVPTGWGAQTWVVGDRTALAVQRVRELAAGLLSWVPGVDAEAPPTRAAAEARTRVR